MLTANTATTMKSKLDHSGINSSGFSSRLARSIFFVYLAAVNVANPNDIIVIHEWTYSEKLSITTSNLVLRGLSRENVILDGTSLTDQGIYVTNATHT